MNFSLLMTLASLVSVISSATIWIPFFLYPSLRSKAYMAVVFFIAVSDFLSALGSSVGLPASSNATCWFQGIITNIFTLTSVLWTVLISLMMKSIVVSGKVLEIRYYHHLICWGIPIFISIIPLVNVTYGTTDGESWCWLIPLENTSTTTMNIWKWVNFYGIVWGSIVIIFGIYCLLWYEIKFKVLSSSTTVVQKVFQKLQLYPWIIIVSWMIPCIDDFCSAEYFGSSFDFDTWDSFVLAIPCLQGFFTTAVFWWSNPEIAKTLYSFFVDGKSIGPSLLSRSKFSSKVHPADESGMLHVAREVIHSMSTPVSGYIMSHSRKKSLSIQNSDRSYGPGASDEKRKCDFFSGSQATKSVSQMWSGRRQPSQALSGKAASSSKDISRSNSDPKAELVSRNNSGSRNEGEDSFNANSEFAKLPLNRHSRSALNIPDRISEVSISEPGSRSDRVISLMISSGKARDELNVIDADCIDSCKRHDSPRLENSGDVPIVSGRSQVPLPESSKRAPLVQKPSDGDLLGPLIRKQPMIPDLSRFGQFTLFSSEHKLQQPDFEKYIAADVSSNSKANAGDESVSDIENFVAHTEVEEFEPVGFGRLVSGYQFYY